MLYADDFYATPDVLTKVSGVFLQYGVDSCYGDLVYVRKARGDGRWARRQKTEPGLGIKDYGLSCGRAQRAEKSVDVLNRPNVWGLANCFSESTNPRFNRLFENIPLLEVRGFSIGKILLGLDAMNGGSDQVM